MVLAGPGQRMLLRLSVSPVFSQALLERRLRMGTKPMVFPLDASGRLYALHDENDEQICTGSRETCYRLMELMTRTKRPAIEGHPPMLDAPEQTLQAAAGGKAS